MLRAAALRCLCVFGVRRSPLMQDRVEALNFATRGTYLVICAVNVHLADGMDGWVKVVK